MKTLYVSDLDETLLRSDETISTFTAETINSLIEKGLIFSYATARSYHTASKVTRGLSPKPPLIVYNGTFIVEGDTQKRLLANFFSPKDLRLILDLLLQSEVYPMVRALHGDAERSTYCINRVNPAQQKFLDRRRNDPRYTPVTDPASLSNGDAFCILAIDKPERLRPLYEQLKDICACNYFLDPYTSEYWLEINPRNATKASAILSLKLLLGCDRIVCFGNGSNDVSMFRVADECYAVRNAVDSLKALATAVIDSNDEDGVAKWLLENAKI